MAKESMKAREVKRRQMVGKYAEKRAELIAAGDYVALQKLPKNSSKVRLHNRCNLSGRPKRAAAFRKVAIAALRDSEITIKAHKTKRVASSKMVSTWTLLTVPSIKWTLNSDLASACQIR